LQANSFYSAYGKWAIVAGASEGLGKAFAMSLASRGLHLILIARRTVHLQEVSNDIKSRFNVNIKLITHDLQKTADTIEILKSLDYNIGLLIYNAAYAPVGNFVEMSFEKLSQINTVNINTPLLVTNYFVNRLLKSKRAGGIILMSSMAGNQGTPKLAAYAASKSFNTTLAEGLWYELKENKIDVLSCVAGAIRTPGYFKTYSKNKEASGALDPEIVAEKAISSLGKVPVIVPGRINQIGHFIMTRILPKHLAIKIMASNTKDLI